MNVNRPGGKEMNSTKRNAFSAGGARQDLKRYMRWTGLIGVLLACLPAQAIAQSCTAEREQAISAARRMLEGDGNPAAIQRNDHVRDIDLLRERILNRPCSSVASTAGEEQEYEKEISVSKKVLERGLAYQQLHYQAYSIEKNRASLCYLRARKEQCGQATATPTKNPETTQPIGERRNDGDNRKLLHSQSVNSQQPESSGNCSAWHQKHIDNSNARGWKPWSASVIREEILRDMADRSNYLSWVCEGELYDPILCELVRSNKVSTSGPNFDRFLLKMEVMYRMKAKSHKSSPDPTTYTLLMMKAACAHDWANDTKSANSSKPAADADRARSGDDGAQAQDRQMQIKEAMALAQRNQAKIDKARQGKPKRHVAAMEAHHCLKPLPLTGVTNTCPFAVEYSYCVFRPTKDSWSESFDCERSKGGAWQIGPGPGNQSILHSAGEVVYWFACKYGPTLHHPDGVSPADVHYEPGRGLMGRCAEWGS